MSSTTPTPIEIKMGPCEEPCEKSHAHERSWAKSMLLKSLFNTVDVCFDDVYEEPKRILMVGGCRQQDFAQHIALLLPAAEIVLVDPSEAEVARAKEEICCRFKFIHSLLEQLPFEDNTFDLTFAHNFFAYPTDWKPAFAELGRVTGKNLFISKHRPFLWKLTRKIGGMEQGMRECGIELPAQLPSQFDFLTAQRLFSKIKTHLAPYPWDAYMLTIKPDKQTCLKLS